MVGGDDGNRVFECTPPQSNYDTIVLIDFAQYARLIVYVLMFVSIEQIMISPMIVRTRSDSNCRLRICRSE